MQSIDPGDPVLLSFDSCSSCSQCHGSHPAYCDEFAKANYIGRQQRVSLREGDEAPWTKFFGQSSFAQYSVVSQATIVNVKNLLHHQNELKLFAPLGCGFQTGMGAVLNTAEAGATDIVMVLGLGAVGMGAVMVSASFLRASQCQVNLYWTDIKNSGMQGYSRCRSGQRASRHCQNTGSYAYH